MMHKPHIISFPQLGNYQIPITFLLRKLFPKDEILPPLPITKKTIAIGSRHSPDFICVPFKYNLGNYIESLDRGATLLLQTGGGCRYGYYGEIQKAILLDLGYDFSFMSLSREQSKLTAVYRNFKHYGSKASFKTFLTTMHLTGSMIRLMDEVERFVRERIGFVRTPGLLEESYRTFLSKLSYIDSHHDLQKYAVSTKRSLHSIAIDRAENLPRVGIVGELYTMMEPCSNFFIEKELASHGICVNRYMNLSFLLFKKSRIQGNILKDAGEYLAYDIGADATSSVAKSRLLALKQYNGIIHIKPFGCTPEINAMPVLQNISADYSMPILYLSFDSHTSETGIKTRIEAFADMIHMRKNNIIHTSPHAIKA